MSFEDDMIEYGFWDGNDYLDYLMDEADKVYNEQPRWNEENIGSDESYNWNIENSDEYLEFDCFCNITSVDELFYNLWFRGKSTIEKLNSKEIEKWRNSRIIQIWENENPQKAKLWRNYDKNSSYKNWKEWLEEIEKFEEFKKKDSKEWEKFRNSILLENIIKALVNTFYWTKSNNHGIFKLYKIFKSWVKNNDSLWHDYILPKYSSQINKEDINHLTAWTDTIDTFKLFESFKFTVWKFKYPDIWNVNRKKWFYNKKLMFEWIRNNKEIWEQWKKNNFQLRKEIYNKYKAIFDSNKRFSKGFYIPFIEEELSSLLFWNRNDKSFQQDINFWRISFYTDYEIFKLWIIKHKKQWKEWKYLHLWKKEYNNINLDFDVEDYFAAWCKRYPNKHNKWINNGYRQWLKCKKELDIWLLWLYDGNAFVLYNWAKCNIENWNEKIDSSMSSDLGSAYFYTYGIRYGHKFDDWRRNNLNIWREQRSDVIETLLRKKWKISRYNNTKELTYKPTYKTDLKIKELRYLNQLGYNIYQNGLAIIGIDNKYGFINEKGKIVVPIVYDKVKKFRNGYAPVCIGHKRIAYEDFQISYEARIINPQWGVVDKEGNLIIQPIYDEIKQITDSYIVYGKDCLYGIIEIQSGLEIIPQHYDDIRILNNGIWVACKKEKNEFKWAVISQIGNVTPFKYSYIFNSDNDLTMVVRNAIFSKNNNGYIYGEWGYIDKNGNEIEPLMEFDSPLSFEMYWTEIHHS